MIPRDRAFDPAGSSVGTPEGEPSTLRGPRLEPSARRASSSPGPFWPPGGARRHAVVVRGEVGNSTPPWPSAGSRRRGGAAPGTEVPCVSSIHAALSSNVPWFTLLTCGGSGLIQFMAVKTPRSTADCVTTDTETRGLFIPRRCSAKRLRQCAFGGCASGLRMSMSATARLLAPGLIELVDRGDEPLVVGGALWAGEVGGENVRRRVVGEVEHSSDS